MGTLQASGSPPCTSLSLQLFQPLAQIINRPAAFEKMGELVERMCLAERGNKGREKVQRLRTDIIERTNRFQKQQRRRDEASRDHHAANAIDNGTLVLCRYRRTGRLDVERVFQPIPHVRYSSIPNNRQAFSVVCLAKSSAETPRSSARLFAVARTHAGSLRFPRKGCGARYGESVSTRIRSAGICAATSRKSCDFLNVTIPAKEM